VASLHPKSTGALPQPVSSACGPWRQRWATSPAVPEDGGDGQHGAEQRHVPLLERALGRQRESWVCRGIHRACLPCLFTAGKGLPQIWPAWVPPEPSFLPDRSSSQTPKGSTLQEKTPAFHPPCHMK